MNNIHENHQTLSHYEDFEKEKKYMEIWDRIRYKKVDSIERRVELIIEILEKHVDAKLLVHKDYTKIQSIYKQMRIDTLFYMSGDAKNIISSVDSTYKSVYTRRKCTRLLKYIGEDDGSLTHGNNYVSKDFNGATYTIEKDDNNDERGCGSLYFDRLDDSGLYQKL